MVQLRLLFFVALVLGMNSAQAQDVICGPTASLGMSKMTSGRSSSTSSFETKFAPSGDFALFVEKKLAKNSSLGFEALWVQLEGKIVADNQPLMELNGQEYEEIGVISSQYRSHYSYLGVPLYYRQQIGKVGIKGGIQPMLFLFSRGTYEASGVAHGVPFEEKEEQKNPMRYQLDWGGKIGVDYQLSTSVRLRADAYQAVNRFGWGQSPWLHGGKQITAGIAYAFGGKKD